jgi:hypothetical protein
LRLAEQALLDQQFTNAGFRGTGQGIRRLFKGLRLWSRLVARQEKSQSLTEKFLYVFVL